MVVRSVYVSDSPEKCIKTYISLPDDQYSHDVTGGCAAFFYSKETQLVCFVLILCHIAEDPVIVMPDAVIFA